VASESEDVDHNSLGDTEAGADPESAPDSHDESDRPSKESSAGRQDGQDQPCGVLGLWTSEHSILHGDRASIVAPITESFLESLLHKYPQGHVFVPAESGVPRKTGRRRSRKSAEQAEADDLCKMLPSTRSIAFVPLWDQNRGRWFAGTFMWTVWLGLGSGLDRVLTRATDLNYLAAFGNSIMAEVARLDVVGADRAKSDFISSISHELRSPLHGILASAELLHDTTVDLFQYGMIDTIERCGRTLLDTIQHVLDFAKINTFARSSGGEAAKGRPRGGGQSLEGRTNLTVNIDLSLLVEDVVDAVYAGHEFQGNLPQDETSDILPPEELRRITSDFDTGSGEVQSDEHGPVAKMKKKGVDVIVDIGWRPNWVFRTESGAMRRVLMNLFGNALKYTESGWVKVSLQAEDIVPSRGKRAKSIITLTVSDTGRGIKQDYLHTGLFTPFTQEDPMNPGTGLGLSIVLQIVRSLGGDIEVTSEHGVGTEVVVTLTMDQVPAGDPLYLGREGQTAIQRTRDQAKGLSIGLIGLDITPSVLLKHRNEDRQPGLDPSLYLHDSIHRAATQWFGMKVTSPAIWQTSPPNLYVANE